MKFTQEKTMNEESATIYLQINKKNLLKAAMVVDKDKKQLTAKVDCVPDCGMDVLGRYFNTVFCTEHSAYCSVLEAVGKSLNLMQKLGELSDDKDAPSKEATQDFIEDLQQYRKTGYINLSYRSPACMNSVLVAATAAWSTMLEYIVKLYTLRGLFTEEEIQARKEFAAICTYDEQINKGLELFRDDINSTTHQIIEGSLRNSINSLKNKDEDD